MLRYVQTLLGLETIVAIPAWTDFKTENGIVFSIVSYITYQLCVLAY